jgi:hypothetical protein
MKVKLIIGDCSGDGHDIKEIFVFESNKTNIEIYEAYEESCKLTGLILGGYDHTGLNLDWKHPENLDRRVASMYLSNKISKLAENILLLHGIDVWDGFDKEYFEDNDLVEIDGVGHFFELWLNFVKLSLPDLILEEVSYKKSELKDIPKIGNYPTFGYGIFS